MTRWCPVYGQLILKTVHFSDRSCPAFQGFAFGSLFALSTHHANDHFLLAAFSFLVTEMSWAADERFVGRWKLNPSKTEVIDQMKVDSLGANKYAFDFGGGAETIAGRTSLVIPGRHCR